MSQDHPAKALRRARRFPYVRNRLQDSFLFAPMLGLFVGWWLAIFTTTLDRLLAEENRTQEDAEWLKWAGEGATAVIGTITSSMLTFVGVVFSITLVALQMAASQFTPRVIRLYLRSKITKWTLSMFLLTFLFALRVQKGRFTDEPGAKPVVSSALAVAMVLACLVLFVLYVNATIRMMRVTYVIDVLAKESMRELVRIPFGDARPPDGEPTATVPYTGKPGVLRSVNEPKLVSLARRNDVSVRLIPRIGDYLIPGTPLAQVYGSGSLADKKLHRAMNMGIERSMFQDFAFGLRQLADISARALSPAVNDPTTAVNAFDRIHALLGHIVTLPLGGRSHSDRKGVLRLIEPMPTWQDLVDLAYTETRQYGAGSPQVTRRLAASLEDLLLIAPEDRKAPLLEQRALLQADVGRAHADAREREFALTPDRQGIG